MDLKWDSFGGAENCSVIVGRGALGTITKRNFIGSKLLFAFHLS